MINTLRNNFTEFSNYLTRNNYEPCDYILKIVYCSMYSLTDDYLRDAKDAGIKVLDEPLVNYFHSLVQKISKSAKYEIIQFLGITYSEIFNAKKSGGNSKSKIEYTGFILPEKNSSYPAGFKIVSLYMDPDSLLKKSFVLRKNSWLDPDTSYQRMLDLSKIKQMRKYLSDEKRVYLGNIIATFPSNTSVNAINETTDSLNGNDVNIQPVKITLPDEYNVIGLIDGQHRIYSYHEGIDKQDFEINKLRHHQNLLITGIIYPEGIHKIERIKFEAKLFLEINSKQTKVKSELIQEIKIIVDPYSLPAIGKVIILKLAETGALKDKIQKHSFDHGKKLKASSIISYGLPTLIKLEDDKSLFNVWCAEKEKKESIIKKENYDNLTSYIEFCVNEINFFLNAVKASYPEGWEIGHNEKMLTTTSINGFLNCLKLILENQDQRGFDFYKSCLQGICKFKFSDYKSSHWSKFGKDFYQTFFASRE